MIRTAYVDPQVPTYPIGANWHEGAHTMIHAYAHRFQINPTKATGFDHAIHHTSEQEDAFFLDWAKEQERQGRTLRTVISDNVDRLVFADTDEGTPAVYHSYTVTA